MGQQQLILLVLATIIVGLAIVVGIRAFNENAVKSNADAMIQDAVRIANDLQAWKQKPAPFGGQASTAAAVTDPTIVTDPANFTGADWALLGYGAAAGPYVNLNGSFVLGVAAAQTTITGTNLQLENVIQVTVNGLDDIAVNGVIQCLGGENIVAGSCPGAAAPAP